MSVIPDSWRRLWRRDDAEPDLVPYETTTYLRHGVVVPALPERDDQGYGWPEGYLAAHAEADARHASLMAASRKRSTQLANDIEEAAHVRALDGLRRADEILRAQNRLERTRRLINANDPEPPTGPIVGLPLRPPPPPPFPPPSLVPDPVDELADEPPVDEPDEPDVEPEQPAAADGDYRRVPAGALTKTQAQAEARRLTAAGRPVTQRTSATRDLAALQADIAAARAALGETEPAA